MPDSIPARRTTLALLAAATAIGALGLAAGGSAGALLAEDMTGSTALAGLPLGVLVSRLRGGRAGHLASDEPGGGGVSVWCSATSSVLREPRS